MRRVREKAGRSCGRFSARERQYAEQLRGCLCVDAGRGAENVRGPAPGGIGSALQK